MHEQTRSYVRQLLYLTLLLDFKKQTKIAIKIIQTGEYNLQYDYFLLRYLVAPKGAVCVAIACCHLRNSFSLTSWAGEQLGC